MARLFLGIDLGGTDCKFGLVDEAGRVVRQAKHPTRAELGPEGVLDNIAVHARELMAGEAVAAVGMGVPGPMSSKLGVVHETPNMPVWINIPVRDRLTKALGLPMVLHNDANAAAYGEFWAGAGREAENMILFTLGTGVGGGIVLGGELFTGPDDTAAELGHMCIQPDGPVCGCGSRGCVEAFASATAVRRMVLEGIRAGRRTTIEVPPNEAELGAKAVAEAAAAGDAFAAEVFDTVGMALGVATANIIHIFNPDMIVFGGAMAGAGNLIFEPVRRIARQRAFPQPFARVRIVPAELGPDAGIVGAAGLAMKL